MTEFTPAEFVQMKRTLRDMAEGFNELTAAYTRRTQEYDRLKAAAVDAVKYLDSLYPYSDAGTELVAPLANLKKAVQS